MDEVCWGIVGCGDVTEVKSGPALQQAHGSRLTVVMRRDAAKAADYARRHNVERWYANADELINDSEVNAVYVATPQGSHEEYALKVCGAGKPCYVEKPFTRNAAEAQRIVEAFARRGLPLFVAYYRRALPRFLKAKEILESRALGRLHKVAYRYVDNQMKRHVAPLPWRLQAEHSGGGLFLDLGSHALDALDFLCGPVRDGRGRAMNRANQYEVEDGVEVSFVTVEDVVGTSSWDFAGDERADEFLFAGEAGELRFSCFGNEPVRVRYADKRQEEFDLPNPLHVQQPLIQMIVDELLGTGLRAPSTGASALRTQALMDTALDGYYGGREDGFWARAWPKNQAAQY